VTASWFTADEDGRSGLRPSERLASAAVEIVDPRLSVIDGIDHALWWVATWGAILDLWGADKYISLWVSGSRHIDADVG
jgi:hypothetical protein